MKIRMKDESRTCRIPARNVGREREPGIDRSPRRELPHCALFHFTLSPFAEWKPSTSHPSNPRLHASASNFIHHNYAARAAPFAQLFASRPRTFPFFGIDMHRLHSRRERPSIDRAFNRRRSTRADFHRRFRRQNLMSPIAAARKLRYVAVGFTRQSGDDEQSWPCESVDFFVFFFSVFPFCFHFS